MTSSTVTTPSRCPSSSTTGLATRLYCASRRVTSSSWVSSSEPTQTQLDAYRIAGTEFATELTRLRELGEVEVAALEQELERAGAPWTPGRLPDWRLEP